jgi:hypothetical protein
VDRHPSARIYDGGRRSPTPPSYPGTLADRTGSGPLINPVRLAAPPARPDAARCDGRDRLAPDPRRSPDLRIT